MARHAKPKGLTVSTLELVIMILFGTVGVLAVVLAHRPWRTS